MTNSIPRKISSGDHIHLTKSDSLSPGQIFLDGLADVTIDGHGAVLSCSEHGSPILIRDCDRIKVQGIELSGPGILTAPNKNYYAAIELIGLNDELLFENLSVHDWGNHGIAHLNGDRTSTNVTVRNSRFKAGGNYGRTDGLVWDGAAVAVGGKGIKIMDCQIDDWTRGIEFENPYSDCSFHVEGTKIANCPHVGIWITPTGFEIGKKGQWFSGRLVNCDIGPGRLVPNGFISTGVCCTGGQDILVSGLDVHGFPDGCGIQLSATMAPLNRVTIVHNNLRDIGRSGILYRNGSEGTHDLCEGLACCENMLSGVVGTPLDFEPGMKNFVQSGNIVIAST